MADVQIRDIYDSVRLPVVQATIRQAASSSFSGTSDQCFINCFPQSSTNPQDGTKETWIVKRPGIEKVSSDLTSILGAVNSVCFANIPVTQLNDVYVAGILDQTGTKFVIVQYRPITGTSTKIGEITGVSGGGTDQLFITELTIAAVAYIGVVWNSSNGTTSKGFYAASAGGVFTAASLTEITDTDFPPKRGSPLPLVGPMIQMNGTTYVLTNTGEVVNSDLNSITSWNALGTVQAISYPDQGVGLLRYKNYVLVFGEDSIEFFSDVGNPAPLSPLQRQEQAFIKFGAIHAKGIVGIDDSVYWLGRSSSGAVGLWKLDGFTPVKLSGAVEDQNIEYTAAFSGTYQYHQLCPISILGQKNIIIGGTSIRAGLLYSTSPVLSGDPHSLTSTAAFNTSGIMAYNLDEKVWWCWRAAHGYGNDNVVPMTTAQFQLNNTSASVQYILWGADAAASNLGAYIWKYNIDSYQWSDTIANGTTVTYPVVYQANRWMVGNQKRKRIHKWHVLMDMLYSNPSDTDASAYIWFLWAKDNWDPSLGTSMNRFITVPNLTGRYYIANLGSGRTWATGIATMNKMAMRIRSFEFDLSQGSQ